ncbi:monofunctional biosynthetic peptidoglycan transglycosylase [Chthonobacter albigriseus]|uniref:monofunctional biosynthetic peptidoglycan transglycosylase n=1 Tax=Chthonobacter albigriseus TaxID=1683161 RepID=UPI0015EFC715
MVEADGVAGPFTWRQRLARCRTHRRVRLAIRIAVGIVLLPFILVPVYAVVPPVSTLMIWDLLTLRGFDRDWVPIEEISPNLIRSVVMSEDGRYCEHGGVDWQAISLVLEAADEDGPTRGASTIPMQTVKNLLLWNSRSYIRKGLEIPLALYADLIWSKRRTMEIYLNVAEWGPGIYGAEAAARHHFNKSANELSRREAALMASALPNPILRSPSKPTKRQRRIATVIERRAAQSGAYTKCIFEG